MYARTNSLQGKASASMVPNNLAVNLNADTNDADILFLHKSAAQLLLSGDEESADGYTQKHVACKLPSSGQQMSFVLILQVKFYQASPFDLLF